MGLSIFKYLLVALSAVSANQALACAVCGGQDPESSRVAFMLTTALLSSVPLIFVGTLVWILYKRSHDAAAAAVEKEH